MNYTKASSYKCINTCTYSTHSMHNTLITYICICDLHTQYYFAIAIFAMACICIGTCPFTFNKDMTFYIQISQIFFLSSCLHTQHKKLSHFLKQNKTKPKGIQSRDIRLKHVYCLHIKQFILIMNKHFELKESSSTFNPNNCYYAYRIMKVGSVPIKKSF